MSLTPLQLRNAEATLWKRGDLRFLMGAMPILEPRTGVESLRATYDWVKAKWGQGDLFLLCHRRYGKTSEIAVVASETAIKWARCRIAIITDTKEHAIDILKPILDPFFERMPDGVRPTWHETDRCWYFPNGSTIELYGNEKQQQKRVRGGKFRLIILEEARDLPDMENSIEAVYRPALSDTANSQLLMCSTVPEQEGTACEAYYRKADMAGLALTIRLSENPDYPRSFYEKMARETLGGENGGIFQREYECQFVHSDDTRLVVPEFTPTVRREVVRVLPHEPHWRWYRGIDPGGADPAGVVWVAYDERRDLTYLAAELHVKDLVTTGEMARRIREREATLWGEGYLPQFEGWGDCTDLTVLYNLQHEQNLHFKGSPNDDLWGNMDEVRKAFEDRAIVVDPSAKQFIWEATHSRRTVQGTKILRTKEGHSDVLMAFYYVFRNLKRRPRQRPPIQPENVPAILGRVQPRKPGIIEFLRDPYRRHGTPVRLPGFAPKRGAR